MIFTQSALAPLLEGTGTTVTTVSPLYTGSLFRGIDFDPADVMYAEHTTSYIVTVNTSTGVSSFINKPNAFDVSDVTFVGPDLYSWDLAMGLLKNDIVGTNWATNVNPNAPGSTTILSMATSPSGQIFGAGIGSGLYTISTVDGFTTSVGTGSYSGIVALEFLGAPITPTLSISNLVGGQSATIFFSNMTPGGGVIIGYSLTGAGPTMTPFGLVAMSPPITALPTITADAAGTGGLSVNVPSAASGFTVYAQAADVASGGLSNSLAELVL